MVEPKVKRSLKKVEVKPTTTPQRITRKKSKAKNHIAAKIVKIRNYEDHKAI